MLHAISLYKKEHRTISDVTVRQCINTYDTYYIVKYTKYVPILQNVI